jgi:putative CocE/NonD family hydrolase
MLAFIDANVGKGGAPVTGKELHYFTYGAEEWRTTSVWPIPGTEHVDLYFSADNVLSSTAPTGELGDDVYSVDFTATTGGQTRWGGGVNYPDRRQEDLKLLTYTTEPLAEDTEITGYPVVTLHVSSTHTDGGFFVYLEDVDPTGRVTYLTEGELRGIHRRVPAENPLVELGIPYHSFKEADASPLIPGEIAELSFGLLPISVLVRAGHRIRVAIAGHDAGWFARVPEEGVPEVTVMRNQTYPSKISLPVVGGL